MNLPRALTSNMAAAVAGKLISAVVGLATTALLTRHLGPEQFGEYRTVLVYVSFATILANLGLQLVTLREIAEDSTDPGRIIGAALGLRLAAALAALVGALAVVPLFPYGDFMQWGILVVAVGILAMQGLEIVAVVFQLRLQQYRIALAEISGALITLAGTAAAALLGGGPLAMLAAFALGQVAIFALALRYATALLAFRPRIDPFLWRTLCVMGLPIAGSEILGMLMFRGDMFLLSMLRPAEDVGVYGVATKMFELGITVPYIFVGLMLPILTRALAQPHQFAEHLAYAVETVVVGAVGVALVLFFFADELVALIAGPSFAAAAAPTRIVGLALVAGAAAAVMRCAAIAARQQSQLLVADLLTAGVALVAYLGLIPRLSYLGAALGTLLAETVHMVAIGFVLFRATHTLPPLTSIGKILAAASCAAVAFIELAGTGLIWPLSLGLGGLVYLGILVASGAIRLAYLRALVTQRDAA
jgi:O-antigen/teichoic acid export membrane protein